MENKYDENSLTELIRGAMETEDEPSLELNRRLKAELYQREAALAKERTRVLSIWFVPMILNVILFALIAAFALLAISNTHIAGLIAGICLYMGIAGILITLLGVKRANLKRDIAVRIPKRGVFA